MTKMEGARGDIPIQPTVPEMPKTEWIPEGATNGDVVQIMLNKMFPKTIIVYKHDESRLTINPIFSREWWEMPYKESEGAKRNDKKRHSKGDRFC